MLNLNNLLETYRAIKAHDDAIMRQRPAGHPAADWRMRHPHGQKAAFRVHKDGREYGAVLNCDTSPALQIWSAGERPRILHVIDLRAADAASAVAAYSVPAPGDMTSAEFRAIRSRLGLTQAQLAPLLDLGSAMRISEYERSTNPRTIPAHIARLMLAMDDGWRPADWPVDL